MDSAEDRVQRRVGRSFVGRKLEMQGDGVEARQKSPSEIGNGKLEDRRTDQFHESGKDSSVAWKCRSEAESSPGDRHFENFVPEAGAEVMDLVDDDQSESVTKFRHVPVCALERGHRQRSHIASAIA